MMEPITGSIGKYKISFMWPTIIIRWWECGMEKGATRGICINFRKLNILRMSFPGPQSLYMYGDSRHGLHVVDENLEEIRLWNKD